MTHYLLDACALLAYFKDEPGKHAVFDLIEQAGAGTVRLSMSIVQLLEVYYGCIYDIGADAARIRIESILDEPITIIETMPLSVMYEAGRYKTSYSMSLADTILVATAQYIGATIVTCDHVELEPVERQESIPFLWIRHQPR